MWNIVIQEVKSCGGIVIHRECEKNIDQDSILYWERYYSSDRDPYDNFGYNSIATVVNVFEVPDRCK